MSTKKQLRRERMEKEAQGKRAKMNPATMFMLSVAVAVVVLGAVAFFFGTGVGEPPWPGAVWSPEHGHWH